MQNEIILPNHFNLKYNLYSQLKSDFIEANKKQIRSYFRSQKPDIYTQLLKRWHKTQEAFIAENLNHHETYTVTDLPITQEERDLINVHLIKVFGLADMIDKGLMEINDIFNKNQETIGFHITAFDKLITALKEAKQLLNHHLNNTMYASEEWQNAWDDCDDLVNNKVKSIIRKLENKQKLTDKTPTHNK